MEAPRVESGDADDIGQTAVPVITERIAVPGTAEPMDAFTARPAGWRAVRRWSSSRSGGA